MHEMTRTRTLAAVAALALMSAWPMAQTHGQPEEFTAVAVQNDNLGSGAGTVEIQIDRWSTDAERTNLVNTLLKKGPSALLDELEDTRSVGHIRTPDSLGYDLHYAHQAPAEDGGRNIVVATNRPISFWELWNQPRTVDYPFTIIQMHIGPDGKGQGTMSYATKVLAHDNIIELENYSSAPVMLSEITSRKGD